MTAPFHSDESAGLDDEWLTYGRTSEARAIRLNFAAEELGRTIGRGLRRWREAYRRGAEARAQRREQQAEAEGGPQ